MKKSDRRTARRFPIRVLVNCLPPGTPRKRNGHAAHGWEMWAQDLGDDGVGLQWSSAWANRDYAPDFRRLDERSARRGAVWTRPFQRLLLRIPGIGGPLQTLALSRLAWTLHLTMNTSMDVRHSLALSLRSTQNARYVDQIPTIDAEIVGGNSISESFRVAGGYPADFLDTLAVGEQSGKMVESMGTLARQYQDRARMAMTALAVVAGVAVMLLIAGLIIAMIFRIFITSYLGPINEALKMKP